MLLVLTNCATSDSVIGCAFPSIKKTRWSGGVSAFSKNIQRCGMKFRVTPLSGLYRRMFIFNLVFFREGRSFAGDRPPTTTEYDSRIPLIQNHQTTNTGSLKSK